MKRTIQAFAAGIVTMAAAVFFAGNWTPLVSLAFGFAIAFTFRRRTVTVYRQGAAPRQVKPAAVAQASAPSPVELELTSALMNMGSRKPAAVAAARYALAQDPAQSDIVALVRTALRAPKAA
jgi:hypothetical protein